MGKEGAEAERISENVQARLLELADEDGNRLTPVQARHMALEHVDWHDFANLLEGGATIAEARRIVRAL